MRQSSSDYSFISDFSAALLKVISFEKSKVKSAYNNSDLTSSIIHELKTPLNAIMGFANLARLDAVKNRELAAENSASDTSSSQKNHSIEYLIEIEKAAAELGDLINDLLEVGSASSSSKNFSVDLSKEIKISEVMVRAVKLNYDFSLRRKITIKTEIAEELAKNVASVKLDEKRMKQILTNLISNSIKYSPERTEVKISAKILSENSLLKEINTQTNNKITTGDVANPPSRSVANSKNTTRISTTANSDNSDLTNTTGIAVNPNCSDSNSTNTTGKAQTQTQEGFANSSQILQIIVADQGFGMSKDEVEIAFEKYQTIANPNSGIVDSFGLGLPIVKELTELQGGTILVESQPNLGTKMILNFPI